MPPPVPLLSARQRQLCDVVERLTAKSGGIPPTCREIAAEMDVHFSRVWQLVNTASARGAVMRDPHKARSIRVVRRPSDKSR